MIDRRQEHRLRKIIRSSNINEFDRLRIEGIVKEYCEVLRAIDTAIPALEILKEAKTWEGRLYNEDPTLKGLQAMQPFSKEELDEVAQGGVQKTPPHVCRMLSEADHHCVTCGKPLVKRHRD